MVAMAGRATWFRAHHAVGFGGAGLPDELLDSVLEESFQRLLDRALDGVVVALCTLTVAVVCLTCAGCLLAPLVIE